MHAGARENECVQGNSVGNLAGDKSVNKNSWDYLLSQYGHRRLLDSKALEACGLQVGIHWWVDTYTSREQIIRCKRIQHVELTALSVQQPAALTSDGHNPSGIECGTRT
jgi:hypothetical protein